jgi:hypothetical protein
VGTNLWGHTSWTAIVGLHMWTPIGRSPVVELSCRSPQEGPHLWDTPWCTLIEDHTWGTPLWKPFGGHPLRSPLATPHGKLNCWKHLSGPQWWTPHSGPNLWITLGTTSATSLWNSPLLNTLENPRLGDTSWRTRGATHLLK